MPPGSRVLYLGAASGTTVSHVSDIVGPVSVFVHFYIDIHYLDRWGELDVLGLLTTFYNNDVVLLI